MWTTLETVRGLSAVRGVWHAALGESYDGMASAFLRPTPTPARAYPCAKCGCSHRVVPLHDDVWSPAFRRPLSSAFMGVCQCEYRCDDIPLTPEDVVVYELNWLRVGRAIARAFGFDAREPLLVAAEQTRQIGAFASAALPIVLTIQADAHAFRAAVIATVARLSHRFIILAPSSRFYDALSHELLAKAHAGFFDLASCLSVSSHGTFHARKSAGELFSPLLPHAEPNDQSAAEQALALVKRLETESHHTAPSVLQVFRLYCVDELTTDQIARRCHCAKGTVINRLKQIRAATGVPPDRLRRISTQFGALEERLTDDRARYVRRTQE